MSILSKNKALELLLAKHIEELCAYENLSKDTIYSAIEAGTMVLLANPNHKNLKPILVGQPSTVEINANIGTSPLSSCMNTERKKLDVAIKAGADTFMDFSIAGALQAIVA